MVRFNVTQMKSMPGGRVGAGKLPAIARVAKEYGKGYVHLSVRQTVAVPYVLYDRLEDLPGGTGQDGSDPILPCAAGEGAIACSGCELNPNGNIETQKMAREIERIMILNYLRDGPKTVGEMVDELELKQANVSQHLAILRHSLLVRTKRGGSNIFYELADERIVTVLDLLREILRGQLKQKQRVHDSYYDIP